MKSCPNKEALFGYLVGAIPEQTAEQIAQHVDTCPECERTVQALEGLSDTVITALRHQVRSDAFAEEPALQRAVSRLRQVTTRKVESDTRASVEPPQTETTRARTKRLGDYDLLRKLGQGGMGTVYKARHTKLKRIVALKVLPKNRLASAEAVARFEREMEAVGRLDHPNIVRAMDAREVAGIRFLVMEYVDGLDLAEICNRGGSLSIPDACEVVRQAALGLQCSQENGLVHRDVKPSNLMLTTSGEVKILDLGLAHIQEAETNEGEVTGVGQIMGTPDYMSPEQALESHNVDIRTDVYSLGCTFYRLLADRAPFGGPKYDTAMKKVAAHLHDEADPIQLLRPDLPKPIAGVIERMLSKDPHDRPSTPSAVVDALAPFCQGSRLIGLLRDANRKKRLATEPEASKVETDDLRGSDEVDTSRDGPSVQQAAVKPSGADDLDPYHRWLGIPPAEQPANRYRLLGLAKFEDDPEVIRDAAARQMAHVRTYQLGPHAEMSQKILNELAAAKACLLNEKKRAAYDAQLRTKHATPVTNAPKRQRPQPATPKPRSATSKPRPVTAPPQPATPTMPVVDVDPRRPVTVARSFAERWNPPTWVRVAAGAAALFLLLTIVLYIMTGKGRIKITLSDPLAQVEIKVDGDIIEITGLENPLRLRTGEHELIVAGSGFETISRKFTVRRGTNPVLEVELIAAASTTVQEPNETQVAVSDGGQGDNSSLSPESPPKPDVTQGQTLPATQRTVRLSNWEGLKYGMFIHFGMSTFTGRNADRGDSPSTTYAPSQLDVPQWIEVAKKSGMKYAVLTAKHHSGHCLWHTTNSSYDVSTSANNTDVVAEFMRACHLEGIKPGIYYSIVDGQNEPDLELRWRTPVSQRYFQLIKQQITELHTRHSDIYEQWFDLAGKLNGAQRQELYTLIKKLNSDCLVVMSGQGAGSISGFLSLWPTDILSMYGMPHRSVQHDPNRFWLGETYHLPLEVHATLGKQWWYQASDPVKTTEEFRALWRSTAGKGANLLLNVPPDRTGRIPQAYIDVLQEYKKIIDQESS